MLCDSCYQLYVENSPRLVRRIPQHQHQISSPTPTLLGKIHPFGHTTLTDFIGNRLAVWGHDLGHLTNTKLDTSIGCGGYYLMERNTSNRYLDIIPSHYVGIYGMYMKGGTGDIRCFCDRVRPKLRIANFHFWKNFRFQSQECVLNSRCHVHRQGPQGHCWQSQLTWVLSTTFRKGIVSETLSDAQHRACGWKT